MCRRSTIALISAFFTFCHVYYILDISVVDFLFLCSLFFSLISSLILLYEFSPVKVIEQAFSMLPEKFHFYYGFISREECVSSIKRRVSTILKNRCHNDRSTQEQGEDGADGTASPPRKRPKRNASRNVHFVESPDSLDESSSMDEFSESNSENHSRSKVLVSPPLLVLRGSRQNDESNQRFPLISNTIQISESNQSTNSASFPTRSHESDSEPSSAPFGVAINIVRYVWTIRFSL